MQEAQEVAAETLRVDWPSIIKVGWIGAACVGIFFLAVMVASVTGNFAAMADLLKSPNAVKLIAIVAVIIPTTLLALSHTIPSEAVVAILSGIVGFVGGSFSAPTAGTGGATDRMVNS